MLLALLIYAYCQGVRSSRQIERRCLTDVAFRVLCAQDTPDHATIARFRAEHQDTFAALFTQMLLVAATAVATSKTFQQLARLTGAPPLRLGPFVTRRLQRRKLRPWIDRLATMPNRRRAQLPGVSPHRARQILAGSIVAYEVMRQLDLEALRICPWALREGILLRQLEAHQPTLAQAAWAPWPTSDEHPHIGRAPTAAV
jgi:exopolyphosphatase/guanosine-5'-triphosphate,3'-diphosphate pyrophosphatase